MKIMTKNQIIEKRKLEKRYFCPFCRVLFININYDIKDVSCKKFKWQCSECKKCFKLESYTDKGGGQKYKLPQSYQGKETTYKKEVAIYILNLYKEGFTRREIKEITNFSIEIIENIVKEHENAQLEVLSQKEFYIKYLKISEEEYRQVLQHTYLDTNLIHCIHKALYWGCSIRNIQILLKTNLKTINKAKIAKPFYEYKIKNGKIKIKEDKIIIKNIPSLSPYDLTTPRE